MQNHRVWKRGIIGVFVAIIAATSVSVPSVIAVESSSSNYRVTESEFNAGLMDSCSGEFCARASIGDMTSGESASANYKVVFGAVTPDEPSLDVIIETGESDLGDLSTDRTATKTMIVRIRSYLSNGYTLQITGDPPKYTTHTLTTHGSPQPSTMGVEQFGINLAANNTPNVGANAVQVPSGEMSFGVVRPAYNQPNLFKYVSGEGVAYSLTESGQTDYTISMVVNVSNGTPAGRYTGDYAAIVVPVF